MQLLNRINIGQALNKLNSQENRALSGIGLAILAGFLFVSSDTIVKLVREELPVAMVVWGRFIMHLLIMFILFPGKKIIPLLKVNNPKMIIGRGLLLLTCTCLFFTAIGYIGLAEANSIMFVSPFFVVALSIPLLGEKVGLRRWTAVLVGFLGIIIVLRPGFQDIHWAYFLIVGCAFFFALFTIITRTLSFTETATSMWFYTALVGTIGSSSVVWLYWVTPSPMQWLMLLIIGAIGGGSHYIVIKAYNRAAASLLAPFQYIQILWATIYGLLVFNNFPDSWTLLGTAIIITSGLYVWIRERQLGTVRRSASWRGGAAR
ncbi:MAG: EamA family transporter [Rhodospirillaceae bacterium]|nr:EamA family transporter [Rhodospirillaceae bacterium]